MDTDHKFFAVLKDEEELVMHEEHPETWKLMTTMDFYKVTMIQNVIRTLQKSRAE